MRERPILNLKRWSIVASIAMLFMTHAAASAIIVFPNRLSFRNALSSNPLFATTVEGWDTYPSGTVFPNGSTVAGITYNVSNGSAVVASTGVPQTPPNDLFQTAGLNFRPPIDTFTFGFSQISPSGISAFGITISSSFADRNGDFTMMTSNGDLIPSFFDPLTSPLCITPCPYGQFLGLISDQPFRTVTIGSTANALYGLDDLTFAVRRSFPVPEPGSFCLFAWALIALRLSTKARRGSERNWTALSSANG
jgi:hypothetical protein